MIYQHERFDYLRCFNDNLEYRSYSRPYEIFYIIDKIYGNSVKSFDICKRDISFFDKGPEILWEKVAKYNSQVIKLNYDFFFF